MPKRWLVSILVILLFYTGCQYQSDTNSGVVQVEKTLTERSYGSSIKAQSVSDEGRVTLFSSCIRENGFLVPDPELNADNTVKWDNIKQSIKALSDDKKYSLKLKMALDHCYDYLDRAIVTKNLSKEVRVEQEDKLLAYAECLRTNGIDVGDPEFDDSVRESMKTVFFEVDKRGNGNEKAIASCKEQIYGNKKQE